MGKTDSMFGWTWRSWRISAKLLCPWSTAVPKQQQLHHQQRLPAAYAEQPREPDAQQIARLHLQASAQLLPMHAAA